MLKKKLTYNVISNHGVIEEANPHLRKEDYDEVFESFSSDIEYRLSEIEKLTANNKKVKNHLTRIRNLIEEMRL